jgi:hypothetical protein
LKLPTEAELIEMENRALALIEAHEIIERRIANGDFSYRTHAIGEKIRMLREDFARLIALARDPSQLLQNIPLDEALDRVMSGSDTHGGSFEPPRKGKLTAVPNVKPKPKTKEKPMKNLPPWRGHI